MQAIEELRNARSTIRRAEIQASNDANRAVKDGKILTKYRKKAADYVDAIKTETVVNDCRISDNSLRNLNDLISYTNSTIQGTRTLSGDSTVDKLRLKGTNSLTQPVD